VIRWTVSARGALCITARFADPDNSWVSQQKHIGWNSSAPIVSLWYSFAMSSSGLFNRFFISRPNGWGASIPLK